jgi:hypothetical protein
MAFSNSCMARKDAISRTLVLLSDDDDEDDSLGTPPANKRGQGVVDVRRLRRLCDCSSTGLKVDGGTDEGGTIMGLKQSAVLHSSETETATTERNILY